MEGYTRIEFKKVFRHEVMKVIFGFKYCKKTAQCVYKLMVDNKKLKPEFKLQDEDVFWTKKDIITKFELESIKLIRSEIEKDPFRNKEHTMTTYKAFMPNKFFEPAD